jgi:hypothetical protein
MTALLHLTALQRDALPLHCEVYYAHYHLVTSRYDNVKLSCIPCSSCATTAVAEQMAELSSSDEEGSSDDDDSEAEGDAPAAVEEAKEEPPQAKASVSTTSS